jgi:DtxR family transcriptional regulator, Mn-dependent transcriptional regulator
MSEKLSESLEMYLKTILRLGENTESVRVKAIAESLGITMPSVSEALRTLKTKGLVRHPSYGEVKLSPKGRKLAVGINDRFELLRRFLIEVLKVDENVAEREACEIEHVLGPDTFRRLTAYVDFLSSCQQDLSAIMDHFHEYLELRLAGEKCPVCGLPEPSRPRVRAKK